MRFLFITTIWALTLGVACAQSDTAATSDARSSAAQVDMSSDKAPAASADKKPDATPTGVKNTPPLAATETDPDANRFDISEYQVEGNTVLPSIAIERAVYPHLGPKKNIADIRAAKESLEHAYHDAGYLTVLVDIPEQKVDAGVVRLKVTEGSVERLRVSGAQYYSLGEIKRRVPSLAEGSVPYFPEVQSEVASLSAARDRQVVPTLRAGRGPGKVEVDLKVKDELPLRGSLEVNDRYSADTDHERVAAMLRYDNLWQREHSISLAYQAAPVHPQQSNVLAGTYVMPVGSGKSLALYGVRSRSAVTTSDDYGVLGNANIYGIRWVKALSAREGWVHTVVLGMDYKNSMESVSGGADTVSTPVTYTPLLAQYNFTLSDSAGATQGDIAANFSLRGLRNNELEFETRRYNAHSDYFYWRGGIQRTQKLPADYQLFGRLDFQYATSPLISNEGFSIGGAESVRGYLEGEHSGDAGVRATLELRSPRLVSTDANYVNQFYALGFLDGAQVRVNDPLPEQQNRFTLSSGGVGLRFVGWKYFKVNLDLAWPFKDGQYTHAGDTRVHMKMAYEF